MNKSHFLEAADVTEKGAKRFKIRVISAGVSKNGNYYSPAVLREAAPLFDGARVLVRSDEEHIQGKGKDFRNLIGRLSNPRFVEGAEEIQAERRDCRQTARSVRQQNDRPVRFFD